MNKINYYKKAKSLLKLRRFAPSQKLYLAAIYNFIESCDCPESRIGKSEFINYMTDHEYSSRSQQNQIISGLKFLYYEVMNKKGKFPEFVRPKKEKRLPKVIDQKYLLMKLSNIQNLKHRTILSLTLSTGLRISEVRNLKIKNIDSIRMLIHVQNAKGRKDRFVKLTDTILHLLRSYFRMYRPKIFLFNGQKGIQYSITSLQKISHKYFGTNFHTIRHSAFTSMLENGTDLRIIQKVAGHSSSKTTEIYTHVTNNLIGQVKAAI